MLLGLVLRLTNIIKPEGLWNDEYVSWHVASTPFFNGFWQEILKQCHMPLYYLYLKPFTGCSDSILRLTSVIPALLAIPIMYLVGKEVSKRAGYYAATITSILSFLVYYAQEVRFYSILFLFSVLSLLYLIRYIKYNDKKNLTLFIVSSVLILLTHVIGIIYVALTFFYIAYKRKRKSVYIYSIAAAVVLSLIISTNVLRMIPVSQWWGHFSYTNILFLFSDFFSPILTNNVNAPTVFFYNKSIALWQTIPTLIALFAMIKGAKKGLSFIVLGVILIMSSLAISGKLVFITKYSIEILPILILFLARGFAKLKQQGLILLAIFVLFHLSSYFTPYYVTKLRRTEGHKIVGDILNYQNPQNIIFTYYEPDRFSRYTNFDNKKLYYISKSNRVLYMSNPAQILSEIQVGETVSVVFLDSVSFFDEKYLQENKDNPMLPEMFVTFSNVKNSMIKRMNTDFKEFKVARGGAWTVIYAKRFK